VYQNHLQNLGQAFLLPTGYFIPDDEKQRWYNIAKIKNFLTDIDPNLRVNVDLAKEDENQMKEVISVDFIYKLNRDILMKNPRGFLKYE
jgi:hypothetical protein